MLDASRKVFSSLQLPGTSRKIRMTYRRRFLPTDRALHQSIDRTGGMQCGSREGGGRLPCLFIVVSTAGRLKGATKTARRPPWATKKQSSLYRLQDRHQRSYLPFLACPLAVSSDLSPLRLSRDMWLPPLFIHASSFSHSLAPISIRISRHRLLQHLWMAVRKWMERPAKRPAGRLSFDPDDRKIERDRLAVSQKRTSRALHRKRERRAEEERDSREGLKSERSF